MQSKRFATAIPSCKICHRKIEQNSLFNVFFSAKTVCLRCFLDLKPTYFRWKENGISHLAIYPYEQFYQSLLYQYKGCGDIELAPCFLERLTPLLRLRFHGYRIVFPPSHPNKILERGFDHIPPLFLGLHLPILRAFAKTHDIKQSSQSKSERKKVGKYIRLVESRGITGSKILLVDDVFTTGSTIRACIKLLQKKHPKKIAVLVLAKVPKPSKKDGASHSHANIRA